MKNSLSLSKDKIKIVLFENIHDQATEVFKQNGYTNIESYGTVIEESSLAKIIELCSFSRDSFRYNYRSDDPCKSL